MLDPLLEPSTIRSLENVLAIRNDALRSLMVKGWCSEKEIANAMITPAVALAELQTVSDGDASAKVGVRDFLGGVGLILRSGFDDTVTEAGLELLVDADRMKKAKGAA